MTLTEFLLARIAEDEATARKAAIAQPHWEYAESYGSMQIETSDGTNITCDREGLSDSVQDFAGPHIARHDPARVLADSEAKRQIVADYERWSQRAGTDAVATALGIRISLLRLTLPYADHPDFDESWRP